MFFLRFVSLTCDKKNLTWIFISYGIYETRCVFYIPSPVARGYKTHNSFHKYRMKWKFISDPIYMTSILLTFAVPIHEFSTFFVEKEGHYLSRGIPSHFIMPRTFHMSYLWQLYCLSGMSLYAHLSLAQSIWRFPGSANASPEKLRFQR